MNQGFAITSRLRLPRDNAFGRMIPKGKIYQHAGASTKLKELFVQHVEKIVHVSILATKTTNLPAKGCVKEIHILSIIQRTKQLPVRIIEAIDKAIAYPTIFICCYKDKIQYVAGFKRSSESDKTKWVTGEYFFSDWIKANSTGQDLPLALDLQSLYEQLIAALIAIKYRPGEDIGQLAARAESLRIKQSQTDKLDKRIHKEKQYNRKVELNRELKQLSKEIEELK